MSCDDTKPDTRTSDEVIADAMREPLSAAGDGQSVTNHNLNDLITAAKRLEASKAVKSRSFGLRMTRYIPPGSI